MEISRLASRSDRDGLYKMLRVNRPKVSKKDNKEAKEVIKIKRVVRKNDSYLS